jgi:20S proteasome alpha/beta subunit
MAASSALLGQLHAVVAEKLIQIIRDGVTVEKQDAEGNIIEATRPATASELTAAITFLKNNAITSNIDEDEALSEMRELLKNAAKVRSTPVMPDPYDG